VVLFALGLLAIVAGVLLLVSGVRGVRSRTREIRRAYGSHRPRDRGRSSHLHPRDPYDDEDELAAAGMYG
jgi:hypothetical protein